MYINSTNSDRSLTSRDIIVVTDISQVSWLVTKNIKDTVVPVLLTTSIVDCSNIMDMHPWIKVDTCIESDFCESFLAHAKKYASQWLDDIQCDVSFMGIEMARVDIVNNYNLFCSIYWGYTVGKWAVLRYGRDYNFIFIEEDPPLPFWHIDCYSDVITAGFKYACLESGCHFEGVIMRQRPSQMDFRLPNNLDVQPFRFSKLTYRPSLQAPHRRAGTVLTYCVGGDQMLKALYTLGCDIAVFVNSADLIKSNTNETPCAPPREGSVFYEIALRQYNQFNRNKANSHLPQCIINNRFVDYQFKHMFLSRWAAAMEYIFTAHQHFRKHPIDILTHSDVNSHIEEEILANVCRENGGKVVLIPHAYLPLTNYPLISSDKRDIPFALYRHGKNINIETHGFKRSVVCGHPWEVGSTSNPAVQRLLADMMKGDNRKNVVLLTNGLCDTYGVPGINYKAFFDIMSVLCNTPDGLKDKIRVLHSPRPGLLAENVTMIRKICGPDIDPFPAGFSLVDRMSVTDCVISVMASTTALYEVFAIGKPVVFVYPEHPPSDAYDFSKTGNPGIITLRDPSLIWPTLEKVLFDDAYRESISNQSLAFFKDEVIPDFPSDFSWMSALENILGINESHELPLYGDMAFKWAVACAEHGKLLYEDMLCIVKTALQNSNTDVAKYVCHRWIENTTSPYKPLGYCDLGDICVAARDTAGAEQAYKSALELGDPSGRAAAALAQLRKV